MLAVIQRPNIPTRFVLGSDGQHDRLCCPVCACPYVHPAEVVVEQVFACPRFADHAGFLVQIWTLVSVRARVPQRRTSTAARYEAVAKSRCSWATLARLT